MRHGFARAVWNILGLQLGILFVLLIVAGGIGALLAASSRAFNVVKWVGVAYLVYLGVQQWRAPATAITADGNAAASATPRQLVFNGFVVNATNPKGILFMLAVLPQFIDPAQPQLLQYLICGATLFFTDLVVMSGYTAFAARVLKLLRGERQVRWMNRFFGGVFVAAGVVLATFKRAA